MQLILVVNRTFGLAKLYDKSSAEPKQFGSVRHQHCCRTVRFGSADFFRLLLNSSVRFAEQFGKILAEQFGSVRPSSKLGKFGSVRFGAKIPSSVHH